MTIKDAYVDTENGIPYFRGKPISVEEYRRRLLKALDFRWADIADQLKKGKQRK